MLSSSLLATLLAVSASAVPFHLPRPGFISRDSADVSAVAVPTSSLPDPKSLGLTLQHIGLAQGTQNYTCANSSATPSANTALATLFDASSILAYPPPNSNISSVEVGLPELMLQCPEATQNLAFLQQTVSGLPTLGQHFFAPATSAGGNATPTFDLTSAGQLISAKAVDMAAAPDGACKGTNGNGDGAIKWVHLEKNDDNPNQTGDLSAVYRLETAGGAAPATCEGQPPEVTVPYSALYFFFSG